MRGQQGLEDEVDRDRLAALPHLLPAVDVEHARLAQKRAACLAGRSDQRADLSTDQQFTNFELSIDWKASKGGNSGVMYGVVEDPKYKTAWMTRPEYQFIDDVGFPQKLEEWQKAGANYAMHVASADKPLKPVGEWNTTKIVVYGKHVEHWLNGKKVVEFERWNDEWQKLRDSGKWKEAPDYGTAKTGRIALQDHGSIFWFRNVKIRPL